MILLAYIDPGAGSLFIEAVVAAILVIPFFLRSQIRRGIDRLTGHAARQPTVPSAAPHEDSQPPEQG